MVVSAYTMGLGVIRSLGRRGVPVIAVRYDRQDFGHTSRFVTRTLDVPDPVACEESFVASLLDLGRELGDAVLIPASDASLAAVARAWDRLSENYRVACPPWDRARLFLEKRHTYSLAADAGIPVPATHVVSTEEQLVSMADELPYPVLVKPVQSHLFVRRFGVKMLEVTDRAELIDTYRTVSDGSLELMVQEFITGPPSAGANYNCFVVDGEPVAEFTARKVRNNPPTLGSPRVVVSEHLPEVVELGRRVMASLGHEGFACTEFKRNDKNGEWTLMEVNGRHNLSSALAVEAGIDFPWVDYRYHERGELPGPADFRDGIYWIDLKRDLAASVRFRKVERFALRDYLRPYVRRRVFGDWDLRDPRPLLSRAALTITSLIRPRAQPVADGYQ
ncbi:MAG TPA: acetate--CoA ligase family protein [Acidimicrobiia bacterium]|nr:acetate--CoA ligase family protein [Acidimicrobiia bacterium]